MSKVREFEIEFIKLKLGVTEFEYHLTDEFFKAFNSSLSSDDIHVKLNFLKTESMFTLTFDFQGTVHTECDRCLSSIELPVDGHEVLLVKVTDREMEDEDDMITVGSNEYKLDVSQHIYDFVNLALPLKKVCRDAGKVCDETVAGRITSMIDVASGDRLPDRDSDETEEE